MFGLLPHPAHPPLAVRGVEVVVERGGDDLLLTYAVAGGDRIRWPASQPPGRGVELWRTTCFEMFLRFDDDERYVEFNFAPSTQWAAYAFNGYREVGGALDLTPPPRVERLEDGIRTSCPLADLPRGEHRMGLSAVIEEEGGILSYWALAHPPGAPDFHHPACLAATLPPPAGL